MKEIYKPDLKMAEEIVKKYGTPTFVSSKEVLFDRVQTMKKAFFENTKIFYAVKANYNPFVLKSLYDAGVDGVDTVSPFEVKLAKKVGFKSENIIFTGNSSSEDEIKEVVSEGVLCNIGSLDELEVFGANFPGSEVSLRFNPGIGDGESKGTVTGGKESKFGIIRENFEKVNNILNKYNLKIVGVHCHIGSGFYSTEKFSTAVQSILQVALDFKGLKFVDFGGGFGVRYEENKKPINLEEFASSIRGFVEDFNLKNGKKIEIRLEPGKFLVAESTCLLTRVTMIQKTYNSVFVGTDTGFNHLIRPALYGASHPVCNLSSESKDYEKVNLVGNICESTDLLAKDTQIKKPCLGDIIAILTAGAYCSSMSMAYNLRPYANEVLVDGNSFMLTRKKMDFDVFFNGLGFVE